MYAKIIRYPQFFKSNELGKTNKHVACKIAFNDYKLFSRV